MTTDEMSKKMCTWTNDDPESNFWVTECGKSFEVNDGTPLENDMRFCCFCGGELIEEIITKDDEEEQSAAD